MPDLGSYTVEVLSSYAVTLALIAGLIWLSVARARMVLRALKDAEARLRNG